jgi:hypothetical protein
MPAATTARRSPRLDWSDPEVGTIDLAVIRRAATDGDAIGSLLTNPVGRARAGTTSSPSPRRTPSARRARRLRRDRLRPRGVGRSTAVKCLDASDGQHALRHPGRSARQPGWTDELTQRNRDFVAACEANSGGILPYITTDNAARDMDLLRAVLGDASSTTSATPTAPSSARPTRSSSPSASGGSCSTARSTRRCPGSTSARRRRSGSSRRCGPTWPTACRAAAVRSPARSMRHGRLGTLLASVDACRSPLRTGACSAPTRS